MRTICSKLTHNLLQSQVEKMSRRPVQKYRKEEKNKIKIHLRTNKQNWCVQLVELTSEVNGLDKVPSCLTVF